MCFFSSIFSQSVRAPQGLAISDFCATVFNVEYALQGGAAENSISAFVVTALICGPWMGGRYMTPPRARKTGIPDLGTPKTVTGPDLSTPDELGAHIWRV